MTELGKKPRYYYSSTGKPGPAGGQYAWGGHWIEFPSFRNVDAEYQAWAGAEQRCQNPNNASYADYGGRGISMEFASFQAFMEEIGPKPSPELSLDRIDNDGNYAVGNIRWATKAVQARNKLRKQSQSADESKSSVVKARTNPVPQVQRFAAVPASRLGKRLDYIKTFHIREYVPESEADLITEIQERIAFNRAQEALAG